MCADTYPLVNEWCWRRPRQRWVGDGGMGGIREEEAGEIPLLIEQRLQLAREVLDDRRIPTDRALRLEQHVMQGTEDLYAPDRHHHEDHHSAQVVPSG